jgi:predicted transcriptional regulator
MTQVREVDDSEPHELQPPGDRCRRRQGDGQGRRRSDSSRGWRAARRDPSDRDIVIRVVAEGRDPQSISVGEVVSRDLTTVSPDEDLDRALQLLAERQLRRLPVVEGEMLVGVVAQADIATQADDRTTGQVVEQISEN